MKIVPTDWTPQASIDQAERDNARWGDSSIWRILRARLDDQRDRVQITSGRSVLASALIPAEAQTFGFQIAPLRITADGVPVAPADLTVTPPA